MRAPCSVRVRPMKGSPVTRFHPLALDIRQPHFRYVRWMAAKKNAETFKANLDRLVAVDRELLVNKRRARPQWADKASTCVELGTKQMNPLLKKGISWPMGK